MDYNQVLTLTRDYVRKILPDPDVIDIKEDARTAANDLIRFWRSENLKSNLSWPPDNIDYNTSDWEVILFNMLVACINLSRL